MKRLKAVNFSRVWLLRFLAVSCLAIATTSMLALCSSEQRKRAILHQGGWLHTRTEDYVDAMCAAAGSSGHTMWLWKQLVVMVAEDVFPYVRTLLEAVYRHQASQSRNILLVEAGVVAFLVLAWTLKWYIARQRYVYRIKRWWQRVRRSVSKRTQSIRDRYNTFMDSLRHKSLVAAALFPHIVFALAAALLVHLFPGYASDLADPDGWCVLILSILYPVVLSVIALQSTDPDWSAVDMSAELPVSKGERVAQSLMYWVVFSVLLTARHLSTAVPFSSYLVDMVPYKNELWLFVYLWIHMPFGGLALAYYLLVPVIDHYSQKIPFLQRLDGPRTEQLSLLAKALSMARFISQDTAHHISNSMQELSVLVPAVFGVVSVGPVAFYVLMACSLWFPSFFSVLALAGAPDHHIPRAPDVLTPAKFRRSHRKSLRVLSSVKKKKKPSAQQQSGLLSSLFSSSDSNQEQKSPEEERKEMAARRVESWLTYFVVYMLLVTLRQSLDFVLGWLPFVSNTQIVLCCWLQLPVFRGAEKVYSLIISELRKFDHTNSSSSSSSSPSSSPSPSSPATVESQQQSLHEHQEQEQECSSPSPSPSQPQPSSQSLFTPPPPSPPPSPSPSLHASRQRDQQTRQRAAHDPSATATIGATGDGDGDGDNEQ